MVKIKICPKCKNPTLKSAMNVSGWLAPDLYECTECQYVGPLYIEVDSDEVDLEEFQRFQAEDKEDDQNTI